MSICFNRKIPQAALLAFLKQQFPTETIYLGHEDDYDWDQFCEVSMGFKYAEEETLAENTYRYYLEPPFYHPKASKNIEKLCAEMAQYFDCSVSCDASRLHCMYGDPYYALIFENQKVYFGSNSDLEYSGDIYKIIELNYDWPDYTLTPSSPQEQRSK